MAVFAETFVERVAVAACFAQADHSVAEFDPSVAVAGLLEVVAVVAANSMAIVVVVANHPYLFVGIVAVVVGEEVVAVVAAVHQAVTNQNTDSDHHKSKIKQSLNTTVSSLITIQCTHIFIRN